MNDSITGPPAEHGILLLHGAGGSPEANFPFRDRLDARTVAPYYPGTGPAPEFDGALELDDLVELALASVDEAGLATVDVVGYSLGSAVAIRLAARHPQRVRRLVLAAGFAHASPSLRLACSTWLTLLARAGDPGGAQALGRFLAWAASSEHGWTDDGPDPEQVAVRIADDVPVGSAALADLGRRLDVRGDLAAISALTLVVVATADRLVHPAHSRRLLAEIPDATSMEIDAGHDLAGEAGPALETAIRDFLRTEAG